MKTISILTAILVSAFLYLLVFERDNLFAFAQSDVGTSQTPAAPDADPQTGASAVKVVAIHSTARTVDSAVILRGRTEAARTVQVLSETSGLITSAPLRKGTTVETGDLLCAVDIGTRANDLAEAEGRLLEAQARLPEAMARVPEAQARVAEAQARVAEAEGRVSEARARLTEAEINENAAARLSEGGFASDTRVANATATLQSARAGVTSAEAALEGARAGIVGADASVQSAVAAIESVKAGIVSAQAAVASAQQDIAKLQITAPFGGLLNTDTAELGSLLQPGVRCAEILQLDPIRLVGFVAEGDVGKIKPGALAGARLTSGQEVRGAVSFVSRSADETTRTFRVEITVANPDLTIGDGQTAEILVAADGRDAHLLPQSALTLDDNGTLGVRTVDAGNVAGFAPVTLIRDTVDGVWVGGLPDQADIIVVGQEYVIDGVPVEPTWQEAKG